MRQNSLWSYEKILTALAAVVWLGSLAWVKAARPIEAKPFAVSDTAPHKVAEWPAPVRETITWSKNERSDLFAPSAKGVIAAETAVQEIGLTVIAVGPELFRVQLAGYVGKSGEYRATLSASEDARSWVVGVGQSVPELGLTIRSIMVGTQSVEHADGWPVREALAAVVVFDERTQTDVVLRAGQQTTTGKYWAELRAGTVKSRRYREGDEVRSGEKIYRAERIEFKPALIVLQPKPGVGEPPLASITLHY